MEAKGSARKVKQEEQEGGGEERKTKQVRGTKKSSNGKERGGQPKRKKSKREEGPQTIPVHVKEEPKESLFASKRKKQKKKAKKGKEQPAVPLVPADHDSAGTDSTSQSAASAQLEYIDNRKGVRPGTLRNKQRREKLHRDQEHQKAKDKKARRKQREAAGLPKPTPETIDDKRVGDGTDVAADDDEVCVRVCVFLVNSQFGSLQLSFHGYLHALRFVFFFFRLYFILILRGGL